MARIKRPSPPQHIVSLDTNILWHKDKGHVVNPDFTQFWNAYSSIFPMKLIIPDVVKGELLFQQTTSALKLLDKANKQISDISRITDKAYSHRISSDRVRKEVEKRFESWVQSIKAEVYPTPVKNIDWDKIIDAAIWRNLPFTPDPDNPKNEKGFRDAMILETITCITKSQKAEANIAFICHDYVLRKAADNRLGSIEGFSTYDSIEAFSAFVELTRRNLTERFVKRILFRAREKFHNEKGKRCLLYADEFHIKLREEYKARIESPYELADAFSQNTSTLQQWCHVGAEQAWVTRPLFKDVEGENTYHWLSKVTYVRSYERDSNILPGFKDKRLMILSVDINWTASVRNDGRFFDCKIIEHKESSYSFNVPKQEELERYGIIENTEQKNPADS